MSVNEDGIEGGLQESIFLIQTNSIQSDLTVIYRATAKDTIPEILRDKNMNTK